MQTNVIFFAWNRSIPGREPLSSLHFHEFVQYLVGLQSADAIQSFATIFLDAHGGVINGLFLIQAETAKLDSLLSSAEWVNHTIRAAMHLEGLSIVRGVTGAAVMDRMKLWTQAIPIIPKLG